MTDLKDIGEFGFIERFSPLFSKLVKSNDSGIGDDCALISINNDEYHLISTDLLIEDIHFIKNKISPRELGHKSLAVNLSDIAAMGGKALYSFLSIGIPKNTSVEYLDEFMAGYYELSEKHNVALMGGDTTKSIDKLTINVAVVGICKKADAKLRSMAKTGDIICTTGTLGNSAGGLKVLLNNIAENHDTKALVDYHHTPIPRLNEGYFLAQQGINAMMDISDGIASDLTHILKASKVSAKINLDSLPISTLLQKVSSENSWNCTDFATSGGEDYELLFTVEKKQLENIKSAYFNQFNEIIYPIGEITEGNTGISWYKNEKIQDYKSNGFNHFKK